MSDFSGRRDIILTRNIDAVRNRLVSCGVRYEFVQYGHRTQVRYEDTPKARAYVAEYRLPVWDEA